jgi:glycerol uptake operon antiterminator
LFHLHSYAHFYQIFINNRIAKKGGVLKKKMQVRDFLRLAQQHPVAAAIKSEEEFVTALSSKAALVFILKGNAFHLSSFILQAHERSKGVVVHIDLISGIGKDRAGIHFLRNLGVDAIITSRSQLIAAGKAEKLVTIQRLLLLDDLALETGVRTVARSQPDIIEVLPGVIFPEVAPRLLAQLQGPFIAGGFIRTVAEVEHINAAGALLCSSSTQELWG